MFDELLCRAKRKDNGKWMEGYCLFSENERSYIARDSSGDTMPSIAVKWDIVEVDADTVCRYTCREDCGCAPVWEKDILCCEVDLCGEMVYGYGVVEWGDTGSGCGLASSHLMPCGDPGKAFVIRWLEESPTEAPFLNMTGIGGRSLDKALARDAYVVGNLWELPKKEVG